MYLKSLQITKLDNVVVRDIRFKQGINLIVDETSSTTSVETGNNVGKTTVLKLIHYCLGAKKKNIYADPENSRREYKLVKDFLHSESLNVTISLTLSEDLNNEKAKTLLIERNFLTRKKKIQRINGQDLNDDEFKEFLTEAIAPGHFDNFPTFKQIIGHNIRYDDESLGSTLRFLSRYTTDIEYETLHLFMLGCPIDEMSARKQLLSRLSLENKYKARLESEQSRQTYESALAINEDGIRELNEKKRKLGITKNREKTISRISDIKYEINRLSSDINQKELRRELIEEARRELESQSSNVDIGSLKAIYQQAKVFIPDIQKKFVELEKYHNEMLTSKIEYISKELPGLLDSIGSSYETVAALQAEEKELRQSMTEGDDFDQLEKIISDLNKRHQQKGELENRLNQIIEVDDEIQEITDQLDQIDNYVLSDSFKNLLKEKIQSFNKYFSKASMALYGEEYGITYDMVVPKNTDREVYKFRVFSTNFSSGKKQGEASCFDIAYTEYADANSIPCFHFLLNDKKELVHDNQLVEISNYASSKGVQFVASILRDKLPRELNNKDFFIINLSQDDKLFRIENPD